VFKRRKPDEPASALPLPAGEAEPQAPSNGSSNADLGVPAFRPAIPKEPPTMARPPFPAAPQSPSPTGMPLPPGATPGGMGGAMAVASPVAPPGTMPGTAAPRPGMLPGGRPAPDPIERRTLVVGRGISVQGVVQDAERLVVEGTVEATMIQATELSVAPGGMFKGEVEVEDAEIAGTIDGTLTAKGSLTVRATGKVLGTAKYRRLQVEDGGQITGRMEMITEPARMTFEPTSGQ
jgi:cytoskeletal protein CcmA (bactofilin family)